MSHRQGHCQDLPRVSALAWTESALGRGFVLGLTAWTRAFAGAFYDVRGGESRTIEGKERGEIAVEPIHIEPLRSIVRRRGR